MINCTNNRKTCSFLADFPLVFFSFLVICSPVDQLLRHCPSQTRQIKPIKHNNFAASFILASDSLHFSACSPIRTRMADEDDDVEKAVPDFSQRQHNIGSFVRIEAEPSL
jgi:hypothetical protein